MSLNIRSLTPKLTQLKNVAADYPTDIIALSEIWTPYQKYVQLTNYHPIIAKTGPSNRNGGGVGLYINRKLKSEPHNELNNLKFKLLEIVASTITTTQNTKLIIISAYRPPNTSVPQTLEDLEKLLSAVNNQNVIITGDINIDTGIANQKPEAQNYIYKLLQHKFIQTVLTYTRLTANSKSTIDHAITNQKSLETIVTHQAISDHQITISTLGKTNTNKSELPRHKQIKTEIDVNETIKNIKSTNWSTWMTDNNLKDLEPMYNSFHQNIQKSLVLYQTVKRKKRNNQPFYNEELREMRNMLTKKRKKFLKSPTAENERVYKDTQKRYNRALKVTKENYYEDKLHSAGKDTKQIWKTINELLNNNNPDNQNESITYNGREITNKKEIAHTLSNYYKNAATDKLKSLHPTKNFKDFLKAEDKKPTNLHSCQSQTYKPGKS